jgi:hypothetical protein
LIGRSAGGRFIVDGVDWDKTAIRLRVCALPKVSTSLFPPCDDVLAELGIHFVS